MFPSTFRAHHRRVVVTGLGVVSSAGCDLSTFWTNVVTGRHAAAPIRAFDTSRLPCKLGAEVLGFDASNYLNPTKLRRFDPALVFCVAAAKKALLDSGLSLETVPLSRVGVVEGASVTGIHHMLENASRYERSGHRAVSVSMTVNAYTGGGASEVAIELGLRGTAATIANACSSGNDAISYAADAIAQNRADAILAGASDAPLVAPYYSVFLNAGVLSQRPEPASAMLPFDVDRAGFVLGEGSAFLVLEELTHAVSRGASIYAELLGYGQGADAFSNVATPDDGRGMFQAVEQTLLNAQISPDEVDYCNAHASATQINDPIELSVYNRIFGRRRRRHLQVSGTKPATGHTMGAIAAIEAAICCLAIRHQIIPPTAGLTRPIPSGSVDLVRGEARPFPVRTTLNYNAGFGGKCSALVFSSRNL